MGGVFRHSFSLRVTGAYQTRIYSPVLRNALSDCAPAAGYKGVCREEDCLGTYVAHLLAKERIVQCLEAKEEE
jgi:hypothetical protein